ncbi:MAG TPA: thrombospondin type 3 repeat-containing protein [bacterium]|nr:thrombospondin type 3 repeat-containing protein [bacterium]
MGRWVRWISRIFFLSILVAGLACGNGDGPEVCSPGSVSSDEDCDGIANLSDNCPEIPNPSQVDTDQDGLGDLCETVPCGDGVCDPPSGECDVFDYCTKDCTQSLCFGLPEGETCGDGSCQPLAGECSDFDPCLEDCPSPLFCFPQNCGDGECQAWEDNPEESISFCFFDCICRIDKAVEDQCHENVDCQGTPGTVCGATSDPFFEEEPDFSSVACACTTCGNSVLDPGEGCDVSAGQAGVEECFAQPGAACDQILCECIIQELDCEDGLDNDSDGLTDCEDPDCQAIVCQ